MSLKNLIRREILAREQTLVGTVVTDPILIAFDTSGPGGESWVVDVNVSGNRVVRDVVVKSNERGRFYAQRGQTVALRRNALGRFDVVGPADRIAGTANVKEYDVNADALTSSTLSGFVLVTRPFEFYQGAFFMSGAPVLTFAAAGQTITRTVGSFATEGFIIGHTIRIAGSALNNATRSISNVSALVLTFGSGIVNEGPTVAGAVSIAVNGGSRWNDGSTGFPVFQLIDQVTGLPV